MHNADRLLDEIASLRGQLDNLTAERDRLRKDAERYRWLRDNGGCGDHVFAVVRIKDNAVTDGVADYDAAIDAAMLNTK